MITDVIDTGVCRAGIAVHALRIEVATEWIHRVVASVDAHDARIKSAIVSVVALSIDVAT
jgi:hypothetical protein